ncbi:MAG: hypothetical protein GSR84_08975 [Desulfurococcales archaeon]|nr:hypothetical protein [Desulfurococcales archaeon]
MAKDLRACRMLGELVSKLSYGFHVFERDHARVEVNRTGSFTTVWLLLPGGRYVLAAFGSKPGRSYHWRCTDADAVAFALYTIEEEMVGKTLYVEVLDNG